MTFSLDSDIGRRTPAESARMPPRGAGTMAYAAPRSRSDQDAAAPDSGWGGPGLCPEWQRARCARIFRMTAGSCSVAIRRRRPPQWAHANTSMPNARCIRTAQLQARGLAVGPEKRSKHEERARHIERSGFLAGRATWGLWLRDGRLSPTGGQGEPLPARSLVSRHQVGIVNAPRCRVRAEDPGTWSSPTNRWPEGIIYDEVSASPREESGQRGRLHARRADDRGGHHWDLGGHRHPALRQRADSGTRGQSAS